MSFTYDPLTMPPPNPDEVATIVTRELLDSDTDFQASGPSGVFTDWEQVWIQLRLFDAYGIFRFLAVERDPMPTLWNRLQFVPGDEVAIYLGGQLAIAGNIDVRQTAYDANTHGVMLQGHSHCYWASKSSVDKSGGGGTDMGNFDNMPFTAVVATLLPRYGVPYRFIGSIDATPFVKLQAEPGETVYNFLERIARPRGVVMGSDENGAWTFIGEQGGTDTESLIEGVNILRMQAIWRTITDYNPITALGQTAGSDNMNGTEASEQRFDVNGRAKRFAPWITVAEQPVWNLAELANRARNEARFVNTDVLIANVTVQGWKRSDGTLWRPNQLVYVRSPMAMLNDTLGIQAVTYTQDSASGSLTTLELVLPWRLGFPSFGQLAPGSTQQQQPPTNDPNANSNTAGPTPAPAPTPTPPPPQIPD
jgi:prophage tail gpP-like protein